MSVYVVTGGGGFIGSHIVEELLRRNETVKVIDNFSTGKRENVQPFAEREPFVEPPVVVHDGAVAHGVAELAQLLEPVRWEDNVRERPARDDLSRERRELSPD